MVSIEPAKLLARLVVPVVAVSVPFAVTVPDRVKLPSDADTPDPEIAPAELIAIKKVP